LGSADLHIILPALNEALDANGNFQDPGTPYIAGRRVGIRCWVVPSIAQLEVE
jgi:hypothetical protein